MIANEAVAERVADALMDIEAVTLSPADPYTWASGLRAPIYCDNRKTLGFPKVRTLIATELANLIRTQFPDVDVIAGTATAGIAHAALAAQILEKPMAYVRAAAKDHGRGNQIEGLIEPGQKVVMVEDLISTGGSVLKASAAVNESGAHVLGVVAIFNYNMLRAMTAFDEFQDGGLALYTLSHFPTLVQRAVAREYITPAASADLATWSDDPQGWSDRYYWNHADWASATRDGSAIKQ